jgi:hypothetical protein
LVCAGFGHKWKNKIQVGVGTQNLQIVFLYFFMKYAEENAEADGNGRRLQESIN